jgi:hypothetical protein
MNDHSAGGLPGIKPDFDFSNLSSTQNTTAVADSEFFLLRSARQCLLDSNMRPSPRMLFGEFWFEGELCILFSDSNVGKSILAVQIGESIATRQAISPLKLQAEAQKVVYFDFELSDKQFENRYSIDYTAHYPFSANLKRAVINPENIIPSHFTDFEEYLNYSIEKAVITTGTKVLVIDNITYLRNETENARNALPLMKALKKLKSKYELSILALAHTPKRDASKPITRNDLQGSKMLMNFCDSSFTIGESTHDNTIRYLKQIKQRNTEQLYGADNVCLFRIQKPGNFLQYAFVDYGSEYQHLKQADGNKDNGELKEQVAKLRADGLTIREVADQLGISRSKVERLLKKD